MKITSLFLFFAFFISSNAEAIIWKRVRIPEAKCGDGKNYSIFIQKGEKDKVLFEFMGGGACWDYDSCFKNKTIFPWLHNYPVLPSYSIPSASYSLFNPFNRHSKVYFPYCTADVFAGDHVATYKNKELHHLGRRNIELAIEHLQNSNEIDFSRIEDAVVYGASAGAIGALIHGKNLEVLIPEDAKKLLIADSPGLHFGETFWDKFSDEMKFDFKTAFGNVGLDVNFNDGAVSKYMAPVLDQYTETNWTLGFMMALEDGVMSEGFGEITPKDHKKLMQSYDGLPYIARNYSNVKMWLHDGGMHTFMLALPTAANRSLKGVRGYSFVKDLYRKNLDK